MSEEAWPTPTGGSSREPLPRVEDLPVAEQGYEQESVKAAFDSFYRHAAQLDAAPKVAACGDHPARCIGMIAEPGQSTPAHPDAFRFGRNWQRYLADYANPERERIAAESLRDLLYDGHPAHEPIWAFLAERRPRSHGAV